MSRKEENHLIIPIDIYRRGVLVFFGSNEELMNFIKKNAPSDLIGVTTCLDDDETTVAHTIGTSTDAIIHAIKKPSSILTLIHEADHAAFRIMKIVGVETSDEEAHAYLQEFICQKMFEWLNFSCDVP